MISEPYESVAFDIVGPLTKGKGGPTLILTMVCMASRWPEAVPLRKGTATEVAEAMTIFTRTGLPLRLLTDRGSVFVGKIVRQICEIFGIDRVQTTAYHPQSNGVLERLHGTLNQILAKAIDKDLDWVSFLPMALFAIRQAVHRETGFSPAELVFGRSIGYIVCWVG